MVPCFYEKEKVKHKKATMISAARRVATTNPFIVYDFYDLIDKIIKENNLTEEELRNCKP